MSRVANNPVTIPAGVEVSIANGSINVKGAKGALAHKISDAVEVSQESAELKFSRREGAPNADA
jgi:large subunit ribosomal protein L6